MNTTPRQPLMASARKRQRQQSASPTQQPQHNSPVAPLVTSIETSSEVNTSQSNDQTVQNKQEDVLIAHLETGRLLQMLPKIATTSQHENYASYMQHNEETMNMAIEMRQSGLKVCVNTKTYQIRGYLKAEFMEYYQTKTENNNLQNKITVRAELLRQAVQTLGEASQLQMRWEGEGRPLKIILEDKGIITECEIQTLVNDEAYPALIYGKDEIVRMVATSALLAPLVDELDVPGARSIEIHFSDQSPRLMFFVRGDAMALRIVIPDCSDSEGQSILREAECVRPAIYRFGCKELQLCFKPAKIARLTNIRLSESGLLKVQHSVHPTASSDSANWIDFIATSLEEVDDGFSYA